MPLQRRLSGGGATALDLDQFHQLEGIAENDDMILSCCLAPKEWTCLQGDEPMSTTDVSQTIKLICSNPNCGISPFMHGGCFKIWEEKFFVYLKSSGKIRNLTEKQKVSSLWSARWGDITAGIWGCQCDQGYLRKDIQWEASHSQSSTDSEGEKVKQKRKRKTSKNMKPTLTIGLPILYNNNQVKRSDAQGIPHLSHQLSHSHYTNHHGGGNGNGGNGGSNRFRNNSMSSNASASSSFSSMCSPLPSPPNDAAGSGQPPRRSNVIDRARHDSGGSIFMRRPDFSSFNSLPKHKINSYHIKMEDECSIGNDDTRCFILSNYATNKMNRVPCVLCGGLMNIFERYPLIDGTFFLAPRQHTKSCIQVKLEGRTHYLSAVCMGCLEGWNNSLHCRFCLNIWDGSQLILGTMYSYDIFAAVPCCQDRLKCTACKQLVIHPEQSFNFFSDYSQTVSCPSCGVQDFHFVKNLETYVTREELSKVAANNQAMARSWAAAVGS